MEGVIFSLVIYRNPSGTQTNYLEDLQFLPPCARVRKKAALTEDGLKVYRTRLFA